MKTWLTVIEAAEYSGLSRDTIYTACERRELRHARVGGRRTIRLKAEWIDAWLERHVRAAESVRETPTAVGDAPRYSDAVIGRPATPDGNGSTRTTSHRPLSGPQRGCSDAC